MKLINMTPEERVAVRIKWREEYLRKKADGRVVTVRKTVKFHKLDMRQSMEENREDREAERKAHQEARDQYRTEQRATAEERRKKTTHIYHVTHRKENNEYMKLYNRKNKERLKAQAARRKAIKKLDSMGIVPGSVFMVGEAFFIFLTQWAKNLFLVAPVDAHCLTFKGDVDMDCHIYHTWASRAVAPEVLEKVANVIVEQLEDKDRILLCQMYFHLLAGDPIPDVVHGGGCVEAEEAMAAMKEVFAAYKNIN